MRWFSTAQSSIAITCSTHLSFEKFANTYEEGELKNERIVSTIYRMLEQNWLLDYAIKYWGYHAKTVREPRIKGLILQYLKKDQKNSYRIMYYFIYRHGGAGRRNVTDAPAIQFAAYFGLEQIAKLLLERGADVEVRSSDRWTALTVAAWNGQYVMTQRLPEREADIGAKNLAGWMALAIAARNNELEIVQILLDTGANTEVRNHSSWTPLMGAAWHGNNAAVRLLL